MKPRVMMKQIGIARLTISVDGQCRRKKNSTATDSTRPMMPASVSSSSEPVTLSPWLSIRIMRTPLKSDSRPICSISARTVRETSTRLALRSLKTSMPTAGRPSRRRP